MSADPPGVIRGTGETKATVGYYGQPVIHGPHWKWLIVGYFFFGGISGSSAILAGLARLFGGDKSAIPRTASYVSLAALLPCPLLLILDLGRPRRFLNMLRTVQLSSPMSMGTWGLLAFSVVCALNAAAQNFADRRPTPVPQALVRLLAALEIATGAFVAGYTGVLLAATAVPLWSKRPAILGPLILSSAMTSGTATTALALALFHDQENDEAQLQRLEGLFTIAEGALLAAWIGALGPTAKPLVSGDLGRLVQYGIVGAGVVAPSLLAGSAEWLPVRKRRTCRVLASSLALAAVFTLRYVIVEGGRRSADDPEATFAMTS